MQRPSATLVGLGEMGRVGRAGTRLGEPCPELLGPDTAPAHCGVLFRRQFGEDEQGGSSKPAEPQSGGHVPVDQVLPVCPL